MEGDRISDKALKVLIRVNGNVPLTKFASPIGFASWGELSSPTRGEEGAEGAAPSPLPLRERKKNRQLSPKG